ncbi:MAG TPA: hypothetical protein VFJ16_06600 [Longimicrobium sp.]|nr:hypothetical protein [Longimicrobium sp.]
MPFREELRDVYEVGIKQACKDAGAYCERVDEQVFEEQILERIYHQIAVADVVLAELTGQNPNVFYEVGYAHALGKRTILLTNKDSDIPFDLKHYPHVVYDGSIARLKSDLETRIRWMLEHPKRSLTRISEEAAFYINGVRIEEASEIRIPLDRQGSLQLAVQVQNPTTRVLQTSSMKTAVITSGLFPGRIPLPDGRHMHYLSQLSDLLPGEWTWVDGWLPARPGARPVGRLLEALTIRIFTEVGYRDFDLNVELSDPEDGYLR